MYDDGYYEVWVTYDGALNWEDVVAPDKLDSIIRDAATEDWEYGATVELYAIFHPHPLITDTDVSCECAQYVTDHHPIWTNNQEA
jgi:hypothetical protein